MWTFISVGLGLVITSCSPKIPENKKCIKKDYEKNKITRGYPYQYIKGEILTQFSVVHFKQKESHIHVISDLTVQELKKLKNQLSVIFVKYKYKDLFGKGKPVHNKYLIEMINNDLKHTCQIYQIPYNIKSHSFRINMISKLLQKTSAQNAADIIGHKDIKSTMAYKRYALNKREIQNLLNKID